MKKKFSEQPAPFSLFFKEKRHELHITQKELALRSGVGLRFIRDVEQGKKAVRIDTLNKVLGLFGCHAAPVRMIKESLE